MTINKPTTRTLPNDEAHLWYTLQDDISDPCLLDGYRSLLSPEEHERYERFQTTEKRHEFLVTRALVRWTLSSYAEVEPKAWGFVHGERGKPRVAEPALQTSLDFNLSNTGGMIACLVSRGRDVGVDVENVFREVPPVKIAERQFAPDEVAALRDLPDDQRMERFFAYWTLKEALLKAVGVGLAFPLRSCCFRIDDGDIRVEFDRDFALPSGERVASEEFHFARFRPTPEHRVAVAVRRSPGQKMTVVLRRAVPFSEIS